MAVKKKKSSKADRSRVSASQAYEVDYVARKFRVRADTVRAAIKRVGNSRAKVYAVLADSKKKSGKADKARISASQAHEVYYVARKFGVSADTVRATIKRVGNSRTKVYAALEKL